MRPLQVDFFVIGAARAGTTSLYNYLGQNPAIFLPLVKECNYFSRVDSMIREVYRDPKEGEEYHMKIIRSEAVYRSLFDQARPDQVKGEVSPSYLFDKSTAARIYRHNPKAKIVVSLRNPVERAYSHFQMHNATGYEPCDQFTKAIKAPKNPIWGGGNIYLEASQYFGQLKSYYDLFPSSQIHVMIYEDWTSDPEKALKDLYAFLGVTPQGAINKSKAHNQGVKGKHKGLLNFVRKLRVNELVNTLLPRKASELIKERLFTEDTAVDPLPPEVYSELIKDFDADIKKTADLIGKPLIELWERMPEESSKKATALD
jgi:hypothetical protein